MLSIIMLIEEGMPPYITAMIAKYAADCKYVLFVIFKMQISFEIKL